MKWPLSILLCGLLTFSSGADLKKIVLLDGGPNHLESAGEITQVVGHWLNRGFFVWDGPAFEYEIAEGVWIDKDYNYLLTEQDNVLKFHDIVMYEIRELPEGGQALYFLLLRYPGTWTKGTDGFVYGERFW